MKKINIIEFIDSFTLFDIYEKGKKYYGIVSTLFFGNSVIYLRVSDKFTSHDLARDYLCEVKHLMFIGIQCIIKIKRFCEKKGFKKITENLLIEFFNTPFFGWPYYNPLKNYEKIYLWKFPSSELVENPGFFSLKTLEVQVVGIINSTIKLFPNFCNEDNFAKQAKDINLFFKKYCSYKNEDPVGIPYSNFGVPDLFCFSYDGVFDVLFQD
jgi:hypothetical protein